MTASASPGRAPEGATPHTDVDLASPAPATPKRRKISFRIYCFSCGRATEVDVAPRRMARCDVCGGTMLVEVGDTD